MSDLLKYFTTDAFFKRAELLGLLKPDPLGIRTYKRLETRTRKENPKEALSFGIYDPLWMLTRQWQFGEFKGDDGGSAIWAKIKIKHQNITSVYNDQHQTQLKQNDALEYFVERQNPAITTETRIEAAHYFLKSLNYSSYHSYFEEIKEDILSKFKLHSEEETYSEQSNKDRLKTIEIDKNENLKMYRKAFGKSAFDGFELYKDLNSSMNIFIIVEQKLPSKALAAFKKISAEYVTWFSDNYLPVKAEENFWSDESLSYHLNLTVAENEKESKKYVLSNYNSGRLAWHSFDIAEDKNNLKDPDQFKDEDIEEKYFTFIPTLAEFQGAPNKRLWAFEDAKVNLGTMDLERSDLATALVLQYVTMYGNDWLITPLELKSGRASQVEGILVTDVFGTRYFIDRPAGETSNVDSRITQKWEMFTISKENTYLKRDFTTDGALFYPPSFMRTEESDPIEEIQFLRDEMSNMIWAVETKINDDCGGVLEGDVYGAEIESEINQLNEKQHITPVEADFSFLFQNSVPLNWIPFSPVRIDTEGITKNREIQMQRSTMPVFFENEFIPIRPHTKLLRKGIDEKDRVKAHFFINEEEILGIGTKLHLNYQRTRWFNGKTYNWIGTKKEINKTQAYSGLSFDELKEIVKSDQKLKKNKDES